MRETQPARAPRPRYAPYPEYRDSGVEWLGQVPVGWGVKRLKYAAHVEAGQSPPSESVAEGLEGLPFLQGNAEFGVASPMPRQACEDAPKRARSGDILLSVRAPVGAMNVADQAYGIGRGLCAIRPDRTMGLRFTFHQLTITRRLLDSVAAGSTYDAVTTAQVGDLPAFLPPIPEQHAIAAFLDRETTRIDELVAKKERLIELLREKRTALITRAVTKGLDPTAPMKDSGVEWLGKVPEHWEVKRLRHVLAGALKYGANEAAELDDPDLPRFVRITDIDDADGLRAETFKSLPLEVAREYLLREGDLLFARSGATAGKTFLYRQDWGTCAYAGYLIRARLDGKKAYAGFVRYFTASRGYWQWVSSACIQATIQNLSADRYANLRLPLPPLPEQRAIAAYLDRETSRLDALIAKVREAIGLLKEYRTALISAAVTGKIDVRGAA